MARLALAKQQHLVQLHPMARQLAAHMALNLGRKAM